MRDNISQLLDSGCVNEAVQVLKSELDSGALTQNLSETFDLVGDHLLK